ncbi:MAG: hypothetical protein JNJ45_02405 [Chthonomonas sp.]|nr:hypothetical protein [Chthonomonas sp.]
MYHPPLVSRLINVILALAAALVDPFPTTFSPELGAAASYVMTRRYEDSEDKTVTEWRDRVRVMVRQKDSSGAVVLEVAGQPLEVPDGETRDQWKYTVTLGKQAEFRDRSEDSEDQLLAIRYAMAGLIIRPSQVVKVGESWMAGQAPDVLNGAKWNYKYTFEKEEVLLDKSALMRVGLRFNEQVARGFRGQGWARVRRDNQMTHDGQWEFERTYLPSDELQVPQRLTLTLASK